MKKLIKSTLLTIVAGSLMMAAPTVTKKAQNTSTAASTSTASKTKAKKAKKSKKTATDTAAPSTSQK